MTEDVLAERVARVRQRFIDTLEGKIAATFAALPTLGSDTAPAIAAVGESYRCLHGLVGIGRTVGFPATGEAAHEAEDVLRGAYQAGRGLTADEVSRLEDRLAALRLVAVRELQSFHSLPQ